MALASRLFSDFCRHVGTAQTKLSEKERKEDRQTDRLRHGCDRRVLLARIIRSFKSMRVQHSFRNK